MTINYKEKDIELKFSFRADLLFEDATGHSFSGSSETEWLQYFFCNLVAITKDETMKFDDFLDWVSDNPETFYNYLEWYTEYQKSVLDMRQKKSDEQLKTEKKKVGRKK